MEDALVAIFTRLWDNYYYPLLFVCKMWKNTVYRAVRAQELTFDPIGQGDYIPFTVTFVKELYFDYVCLTKNTKLLDWLEDSKIPLSDTKAECRCVYYEYLHSMEKIIPI